MRRARSGSLWICRRKKGLPEYQLYNMQADPGEANNLYGQHPEITEQLTRIATRIVVDGRSTVGQSQPNDTPNDWPQLHWMSRTE